MGRKRLKMSDQIRQAIDQSGQSRYRIWKETGIDQATLSRFMNHESGLSTDVLDTLGDYLGLTIVARKKPGRKGK